MTTRELVDALRVEYVAPSTLRSRRTPIWPGHVKVVRGTLHPDASAAALFWMDELELDALYFTAQMSAVSASSRLASKRMGLSIEEVEVALLAGATRRGEIFDALAGSRATFAFSAPITWRHVGEELEAYVELWKKLPTVIIFDSLSDLEGMDGGDAAAVTGLQRLTELARSTRASILAVHESA